MAWPVFERLRPGRRGLWVLLAMSVCVNLAFVGGYVYKRLEIAQHHAQGRPGGLGDQLELTEEQRASLARLRTQARERARAAARENRTLSESFWSEMAAPTPDTAKLDQLTERMAATRLAMQKAQTRDSLEFAQRLTPTQRTEFLKLAQRRAEAQFRDGPRGPRPEGHRDDGPRGAGPRGNPPPP